MPAVVRIELFFEIYYKNNSDNCIRKSEFFFRLSNPMRIGMQMFIGMERGYILLEHRAKEAK